MRGALHHPSGDDSLPHRGLPTGCSEPGGVGRKPQGCSCGGWTASERWLQSQSPGEQPGTLQLVEGVGGVVSDRITLEETKHWALLGFNPTPHPLTAGQARCFTSVSLFLHL